MVSSAHSTTRDTQEWQHAGRDETQWIAGNNGGISADDCRNGPPGHGGFSSDTFGGGCCCSSEGAAGLVKVTWFCKV